MEMAFGGNLHNCLPDWQANFVFKAVGGFMAERVDWAALHDFHNCPVKVSINRCVIIVNVGGRVSQRTHLWMC